MQSFAFALGFLVVAASALRDVDLRFNQVHQACQRTPGLSVRDKIFDQVKAGQIITTPAVIGLHAHCMLNKMGFQGDKGNFMFDEIREAIIELWTIPAQATHIAEECTVDKGTKEANALSLFACFKKNGIDIGQFQ